MSGGRGLRPEPWDAVKATTSGDSRRRRTSASFLRGWQLLKMSLFPTCKMTRASGNQSMNNVTETLVDLTQTDKDAVADDIDPSAGMADLSNDKIVIRFDGFYAVAGGLVYFAHATGDQREVRIKKDSTIIVRGNAPVGAASFAHCATVVTLQAGDELTLYGYQDSGGSLLSLTLDGLPYLSAVWVGL